LPVMIALLLAAAASSSADPALGTWSNPKGTVTVRTARCGRALCGTIVSASAVARDKARAAGTDNLVGTRIMDGFQPVAPGRWEGQAFVPDLGVTVPATMTLIGRDEIQIEGCSLGGYLCRNQVWHRVGPPPRPRR
jgi:uncharacterized protein (DUF2147 family)